jgi:hypothetical protein
VQDEKLEATKAEMGEVREENERLKTLLSHIVRDYQSLQMHFQETVKVKQQAAAADLVSLSLGSGGYARSKGAAHERTSSSSSGTETDQDDQLSLGLSSRRSNEGDDKQASRPSAAAAPLLNLSSDSSADDAAPARHPLSTAACPPTSKARKSPSAGVDGADEEVLQQQAKKARVSVRVKCDTPTVRLHIQSIRARCTRRNKLKCYMHVYKQSILFYPI